MNDQIEKYYRHLKLIRDIGEKSDGRMPWGRSGKSRGARNAYNVMPKFKEENVNPSTTKVPWITSRTIRVPRKGSNAYKRFVKAYGHLEWVQCYLDRFNHKDRPT